VSAPRPPASRGTKLFLGFHTLVWLPYGIYCFVAPAALAQSGGVAFQTPTGSTELRAMYGGLQAAIGALALVGAVRSEMTRTALITLAFLCTGLFTTRLLGVLIDGGLSGYTMAGLVFESFSAAVAVIYLRRG
jgi:hypothetical protein